MKLPSSSFQTNQVKLSTLIEGQPPSNNFSIFISSAQQVLATFRISDLVVKTEFDTYTICKKAFSSASQTV